jgi:hypothetical protein
MKFNIWFLVAVVLFAVALVLLVIGNGEAKLVQELTVGGFLAFAAGHLV